LLKRTQEALARVTPPDTDLPPIEAPAPVEIDPRCLTYLHGRPFVKYVGLLAKAHEAGLVKLDARIEFHSDTLGLTSATATLQDGRVCTEWADAMPSNVVAQVQPRADTYVGHGAVSGSDTRVLAGHRPSPGT